MKFLNYTIIFLLAGIISFSACHKNDVEVNFNINQPLAAHVYNTGDTVKITGTIEANAEIHGYEINLKNLNTNSISFTKSLEEHAATFTLNEYWVNNVSTATDMELEIKAIIDHDGESLTKTITFHCHN